MRRFVLPAGVTTDERRFNRGAWLTLAVACGWSLVVIAFSLYVYRFPVDAWQYGSADTR